MDRWKWQPKEEEDKKKEQGSWECNNMEKDTAVEPQQSKINSSFKCIFIHI